MKKPFLFLTVSLWILAQGPACSQAGELVISENFQARLRKSTAFEGAKKALEVLGSAAPIETEFGGAYVTAISGIREGKQSGKNAHWFYYVNGILASRGAREYELSAKDHLWWDYHIWEGNRYVSALIGAWPEPFLNGYGGVRPPTVIWADPALQGTAEQLKQQLAQQGVSDVIVNTLSPDSRIDRSRTLSIVAAPFSSLYSCPPVKNILKKPGRFGLFFKFQNNQLIPVDWLGKEKAGMEHAAVIAAAKPAIEENHPVWMVGGTDLPAVDRALRLLIEHPDKIKGMASAIITQDQIVSLPADV